MAKEDELRILWDKGKANKCTLHEDPSMKYKELYRYLYQTNKDMRSERLAVTVGYFVEIAQ